MANEKTQNKIFEKIVTNPKETLDEYTTLMAQGIGTRLSSTGFETIQYCLNKIYGSAEKTENISKALVDATIILDEIVHARECLTDLTKMTPYKYFVDFLNNGEFFVLVGYNITKERLEEVVKSPGFIEEHNKAINDIKKNISKIDAKVKSNGYTREYASALERLPEELRTKFPKIEKIIENNYVLQELESISEKTRKMFPKLDSELNASSLELKILEIDYNILNLIHKRHEKIILEKSNQSTDEISNLCINIAKEDLKPKIKEVNEYLIDALSKYDSIKNKAEKNRLAKEIEEKRAELDAQMKKQYRHLLKEYEDRESRKRTNHFMSTCQSMSAIGPTDALKRDLV